MSARTDLLVIGAGPYAYSAAALARDNGIDTRVVGRPMAFWRDHMPAGMFLRSGPDWHLDAAGEHTFEAFFEDRGLRPERRRPDPDRRLPRLHRLVRPTQGPRRRRAPGHRADHSGRRLRGDAGRRRRRSPPDKVLAAPASAHFVNLPAWYADVPSARRGHTSDLVSLRRARRGPGRDHRRAAERVRVGGAAVRPRRRARGRGAPPRRPRRSPRSAGLSSTGTSSQTLAAAGLVAPAVDGAAAGDRARVLAGRPAHPRALARAADGPGRRDQPPRVRGGRRGGRRRGRAR